MGVYYSIYSFPSKETRDPAEEFELNQSFRGELFKKMHSMTGNKFAEKYGLEFNDIIFFYKIDNSAYLDDDEFDVLAFFDPSETLSGINKLIEKLEPDFYLNWEEHFSTMAEFLKLCSEKKHFVQLVAH